MGGWGWGIVGGAPTHVHMHVHACTHTHTHTCMHGKHDNFMQMATPIWGIPGNSLWCYVCVHACLCMCVHMCGGAPSDHPHPRGPQNQSKLSSTWTNWDISILSEDLKSVETPPPMDGCIVWWLGWCVGSGQNMKNFKNVNWIKTIQFCLKIYDL